MFRAHGPCPGDFPVAEDIGERTVTLPLFPAMTDADVDRVCAAVATVMAQLQGGRRMTMLQPSLGHERRPTTSTTTRPTLSVVIPVYNEEQGLAALFERLYPALDALGIAYEIDLRQRRQPRPLGRAAGGAVRAPARRDARDPLQRQLRPAPGDPGGLRALPRRPHRHARRRPAEPARGHPPAAGRDGPAATTTSARSGATARTPPGGAGPRGP